ncbi:MAG: 30S ribosomal protein S8 [bacterium]
MPVNDPIGDMLTRVRNAVSAGHDIVAIPSTKIKLQIARILKEEGYISRYEVEGEDTLTPIVKLTLKYGPRHQPVIRGLKRISKPGRRVYVGCGEIPRVQGGMGIAILTTASGVITDKTARLTKVGGELLCTIW